MPSPPRWPSWKIHTSAPNAALNDNMLSTNVFSGSTTLPVSRNISTKVTAPISASTNGSRELTACALSRLICAAPANSVSRPPGGATACSRSSWVSEACEYSGAVELTVTNALPSFNPVAAAGGPT